jgi:DNA polymerase I
MKLVTVEYSQEKGRPKIIKFCRENNVRIPEEVTDFYPYFWVPENEYPAPEKLAEIEHTVGLLGENLVKKVCVTPDDVKRERAFYTRTWEDNVKFKSRFLIDRVPVIEPVNLRIQYTDIECLIETGDIISIAVYDNYLNKVVAFVWRRNLTPGALEKEYSFSSGYKFKATIHKYKTREDLLRAYINFVSDSDPDILTGWYFKDFDMMEIIKNLQSCNINPGGLSPINKCYILHDKYKNTDEPFCQGRIVWDTLQAYADLQPTKLSDSSLESVSQKELGEGKHQHEMSITEMWERDIGQLIEYNCKDSVLVYRIDEKRHVTTFYDTLRRWTGCGWENLFSNSQMWDIYLLRKVHGKCALPTTRNENTGKIVGAEVFLPPAGIHEWVCLLDLKSLYPSIIITFNMSPETLVRGEPEPGRKVYNLTNGISFYAEPQGLLPTVLLELLAERKKYKTEQDKYAFGTPEYDTYFNLQTAVKVHMNALYGAMLYNNFRLKTREIGESITYCGREIIKWIRSEVQNLGFKVIYGDTDSVFFSILEKMLQIIVPIFTGVVEHLNKNLEIKVENLGGSRENCHIRIEAKKVYSKIFMTTKKGKKNEAAKKRYAGRVVWEGGKEIDEPDIMGFEVRRSNSSEIARELQKKSLKVLIGYEPMDKLRGYIIEAEKEFKKENPDWEKIGIPQGIENLDSYETESPHVRGSKYANEYFGENFKAGDKPKLVYVCQTPSGYPPTDVICYRTKPPNGFKIDTAKMFETTIEQKLENIFSTAGINVQEVLYGASTLDKFW